MAQLGVGDQHAAVDNRAADAGAERGHDHQARMTLCRTIVHLGDAGRVSVVDEQNVATKAILEDLLGIGVDPRLVDVRGRAGLAVGHNGRDGDAERPVPNDVGELVHDFSDDRCDVLRCRLLRW